MWKGLEGKLESFPWRNWLCRAWLPSYKLGRGIWVRQRLLFEMFRFYACKVKWRFFQVALGYLYIVCSERRKRLLIWIWNHRLRETVIKFEVLQPSIGNENTYISGKSEPKSVFKTKLSCQHNFVKPNCIK